MNTIEEVNAVVLEMKQNQLVTRDILASVDAKLDEIRAFIQSLQVGSPVTQEQLDALFVAVDAAKGIAISNRATSEAVLAETDALDEPA